MTALAACSGIRGKIQVGVFGLGSVWRYRTDPIRLMNCRTRKLRELYPGSCPMRQGCASTLLLQRVLESFGRQGLAAKKLKQRIIVRR